MNKVAPQIKVKIDLSAWSYGDWDDDVAKAAEFILGLDGVTVDFGRVFEVVAKKIVREAIECFINNPNYCTLTATKSGLTFDSEEMDAPFTLPWKDLRFIGDPREEIAEWVKSESEYITEDEEDE